MASLPRSPLSTTAVATSRNESWPVDTSNNTGYPENMSGVWRGDWPLFHGRRSLKGLSAHPSRTPASRHGKQSVDAEGRCDKDSRPPSESRDRLWDLPDLPDVPDSESLAAGMHARIKTDPTLGAPFCSVLKADRGRAPPKPAVFRGSFEQLTWPLAASSGTVSGSSDITNFNKAYTDGIRHARPCQTTSNK